MTSSPRPFSSRPRATVWAFLTEKDKLAAWFHPAKADLAPNEDYVLYDQTAARDGTAICWGKVEHWEPPSRLVYSFTFRPLNGVMTKVTWILHEAHGGTESTLRHEGLEAAGEAALGLLMALDKGWDEHFGRLRLRVQEMQGAAAA